MQRKKSKLTLFSPAKLNLFLRVLSKRRDGYHEIASLMQAVSLFDVLHIRLSDKDRVTTTHLDLPSDRSNLAYQALDCFRKETKLRFPVEIHIEKNIPLGGGFGGGSSNVATTLWALNLLCGTLFSQTSLQQWAGMISSDAPFFFSSGTAYATGRGEKIKNLPPSEKKHLYLAILDRGVSTSMVYRQCRPPYCGSVSRMIDQIAPPEYTNDLEAPAFALWKDLALIKKSLLRLGFETVSMTGSGSSFFCLGCVDQPPNLPNIRFVPVSFLSKADNEWYTDD